MEHDPHLLLEGCLIASLRDPRRRLLHLHPRRVRPRGADPRARDRRGVRQGLRRQEHPRQRLELRARRCTAAPAPTSAARRPALMTSLEGERGYPRVKPPFPAQSRRVGLPDDDQQRRDAGERAVHRRARRGLVRRRSAPTEEHRPEAVLPERPRQAARRLRGARWACRCSELIDELRRRDAPRDRPLKAVHPRRLLGAGAAPPPSATSALDFDSLAARPARRSARRASW